MKYRKFALQNKLNYFYQEYMNTPLAPETQQIPDDAFSQQEIRHHTSNGKNVVELMINGVKWTGYADLYVGVDIASALNINSDDTVITVAGLSVIYPALQGYDKDAIMRMYPKGKTIAVLLHIEGGKYSVTNYNNFPGITEALVKILNRYKIRSIKMEANGQQLQIIREVRKNLREKGFTTIVTEEFHNTTKAERIMSILMPIIQNYEKFYTIQNPLIDKLFMQLITLGMSDRDDYPDSLSIAMKDIQKIRHTEPVTDMPFIEEENRYDKVKKEMGPRAYLLL
jgi:hypothetical protein